MFRTRSLRTRLHAFIRFLTCPFNRVVEYVPRGGSVLDIGAGHGVFAVLARQRAARVVAVEPDLRKVRPIKGVEFVVGFDDVVRGRFDAIAIIDVLYKVPSSEWNSLFARVANRLNAGGAFIVKEQDPTARLKNSWNRIQERLASALGLTLGESFSYEAPNDLVARLQRSGFAEVLVKRIDRGYPHPHILYVAKKY